ncbi:MAG: hypothetical protein ACTHK0_19150 [Ginsengibacter sp.]
MKYLLVLMFLFNVIELQAQQTPAWLKNIGIRQSFEDDESKQNPGVFTVSIPKKNAPSYLVDCGLKYNLSESSMQNQSSFIGEYHRNSISDGPVNNLQLGYKFITILKKPQPLENIFDLLNPDYLQTYKTFKLNATAKYRYDKIEGSNGIAATAMFSYFQQGPKSSVKTRWSSWNSNKDSNFAYLLVPEIGIEIQNNFKADSTIYKGFVGRAVAGIQISFGSIFPNKKNVYVPLNRWLFTVDAKIRYDVGGKEYSSSRWHPLIKTSLDFFVLYTPIKLIFGPAFTYGDNPIAGFREFNFQPQQFWTIGFKVQK